jgi:hypothetical protein
MKLTKEDIKKYGTEDEQKLLLESKTRKTATKREIKLKDGTVIPAGTKGEVRPLLPSETINSGEHSSPSSHYRYTGFLAFRPEGSEREYKFRMSKLTNMFEGFKAPSVKTMEKWEWDKGGCKTPVGTMVEPDGVDPDGWPSWMLIMGII